MASSHWSTNLSLFLPSARPFTIAAATKGNLNLEQSHHWALIAKQGQKETERPKRSNIGDDAHLSCQERHCEIQCSRSTPSLRQPHAAPRSFHSLLPSLVFLPKKGHGHNWIEPLLPAPQVDTTEVGERAASPPAVPYVPARQKITAPGGNMISWHLPSHLPMGLPRKKDKVSMCWDTLNKHVFKIEPCSPLVSFQAGVIQLTAPWLFCMSSRGLSRLSDEEGKHRAWLSLPSMSAPPCDAGGIATSTAGGAHLLPSAPRRNAAGVHSFSPKRDEFPQAASATDGSACWRGSDMKSNAEI